MERLYWTGILDTLPVFPPQIEQVQHPLMINQTVNNNTEKYVGIFNQTVDYWAMVWDIDNEQTKSNSLSNPVLN